MEHKAWEHGLSHTRIKIGRVHKTHATEVHKTHATALNEHHATIHALIKDLHDMASAQPEYMLNEIREVSLVPPFLLHVLLLLLLVADVPLQLFNERLLDKLTNNEYIWE